MAKQLSQIKRIQDIISTEKISYDEGLPTLESAAVRPLSDCLDYKPDVDLSDSEDLNYYSPPTEYSDLWD